MQEATEQVAESATPVKFTEHKIARFLAKVRKTESCWLWMGYRMKTGYGLTNHKSLTIGAHRLSWMMANERAIPPLMFVCHDCDTPACVNPAHLFLGTHADNMADKVRKGRQVKGNKVGWGAHPERVRGELHRSSKLTSSQVLEIRKIYAAGGVTQVSLGEKYNCTKDLINKIVHRKIWTHL